MKPTSLKDKWGGEAMALGWVALPTSLLFLQSQLGISPTGLNIIIQLIMHWWSAEERPHPSQESIAGRMGVSQRTVQREIAELVRMGIIRKQNSPVRHPKYKGRNLYDLTPLVALLNENTPALAHSLKTKRRLMEDATSAPDGDSL